MRIVITGGSGFIGTNLIDKLIGSNTHEILNLDVSEPKNKNHLKYWKHCNILNLNALTGFFKEFKPEAVIHLAARTDTDPANVLEDYIVNTEGSSNILKCINESPEVSRVIITSTQFVHQYDGLPLNDEDYAPHTIYGESKVIMERMTRNANLKCTWTIIRPTNIWGPWHIRYPFEFWMIVSKGLYFHPGRKPVMRSYGYVGNVVFQIIAILNSPSEKVNKEVFYVGDYSIDLYNWVNGFSIQQTGKPVRVIPRFLVKTLGLLGDVLGLAKIKFPITSSRFKSMTNSNTAPMDKTYQAFGNVPYSLDLGIKETVSWMEEYFPHLVKRKEIKRNE